MTRLQTIAGTEIDVEDFAAWNERMFLNYGNDRLYYHPNVVIRKIQSQRINTIVKFMNVNSSDVVLDAGCGEGYLFSRLASGHHVGIDLSAAALELAFQRNSNARWIRADLQSLPFRAQIFDKVCCSEVIEHVVDPNKVIKELHRVVKPSGRVVITVPNERSINRLKDFVLRNFFGRFVFPSIPLRTEWHLTEYTPDLLRSQLLTYFKIANEKVLPLAGLGLGYATLCIPR